MKKKLGYDYQVGGSLPGDSLTYIVRQADSELFENTIAGQFCYILNSRHMGKSSLRVRTMKKLATNGVACGVVDLTAISRQDINEEQWYASITYTIASSFQLLESFPLPDWWCDRKYLSPGRRLEAFIRDVLLTRVEHNIVLFVDEIDTILNLPFPVDDFFALIRNCYERRTINNRYQRLTWVLLGVANPSELITDKSRNPFDVGREISLTGLELESSQVLAPGLAPQTKHPQAVLKEILAWTGGQPFLTQKLCQLVRQTNKVIPFNQEAKWIAELVSSQIIDSWETQDEPEHLRSIRDRLLGSPHKKSLLHLYQKILRYGEIPAEDTTEQMELCLSGLVVKHQEGKLYAHPILRIDNPIYQAVFNASWLEHKSGTLTPSLAINSHISDEQKLYDRLLNWVQKESPLKTIERFRQLFIYGRSHQDQDIALTLHKIIFSQRRERQFKYIINRCCRILINHWQIHSAKSAIPSLLALLKGVPRPEEINHSNSQVIKRLQQIRNLFANSEEYQLLHSLFVEPVIYEVVAEFKNQAEQEILQVWLLLNPPVIHHSEVESIPLKTCLYRYPYLYSHYWLKQKSYEEQQQLIQQIQGDRQREFALDLHKYASTLKAQKSQTEIANPTLLSNQKLSLALKQFSGKVEGAYSYRDLANIFTQQLNQTTYYGDFKKSLYEYLITTVEPVYGQHRFNQRLLKHLQNTSPERNEQILTDSLLTQTCCNLVDFLVESPHNPNYLYFVDLITNLGNLEAMGLLLKIILLCGRAKPTLEKRFAIIFNHYESQTINETKWFVDTLENFNVALVTNFSAVDLFFIEDNRIGKSK
ncbi:MAG: AAA-like domain-containing protein [Spirulinaceae cyanobacterium]